MHCKAKDDITLTASLETSEPSFDSLLVGEIKADYLLLAAVTPLTGLMK